jgi:hypothetical protein
MEGGRELLRGNGSEVFLGARFGGHYCTEAQFRCGARLWHCNYYLNYSMTRKGCFISVH